MFIRNNLSYKLIFAMSLSLAVLMVVYTLYSAQERRSTIENQLESKGHALAKGAAEGLAAIMENDIRNGIITEEKLFDRNYIMTQDNSDIKKRKYTSAFNEYSDNQWQKYIDSFLVDEDVALAAPVAKSGNPATEGYLATHNSKFKDRSDRLFNDKVGTAAATTTEKLKQIYYRDTGEVMWDFSYPIIVNGKQWGGFRVAISIERIEEVIAKHNRELIIAQTLILVLIVLVIVLVSKWILSRPLKTILAATENLASGQGDLTQRLEIKSHDELGTLASHINKFIDQIQEMVKVAIASTEEVTSTSDQLASTVELTARATAGIAQNIEEVAQGNRQQTNSVEETVGIIKQLTGLINDLAQGAANQSHNIQQVSAVISEMAGAVDEVATSIEAVAASSQMTSQVAEKGGQAVDKTITGMEQIKRTVFESAQKIKELGESSQQIGEIIEVIDDIAEQTNLLALNAAIEAARAGEHGKGFAVVADEVRKLAERSSKSTKEINNLVSAIQKGTENAVRAMEVGTKEVELGAHLAEEAGKALEEILSTVAQSSDQVLKISAAAEQMAASSTEAVRTFENITQLTEVNNAAAAQMAAYNSQVNSAIGDIANVAERTAEAAQEVSAATEEVSTSTEEIAQSAQDLAKMSHELHRMINKFKV
ncbi:MAG: methyl-accepting chemotaxis protein [Clostridia bacterium]|nr:methyl-accepting chemotaxis protein [Clostridia bacterium]